MPPLVLPSGGHDILTVMLHALTGRHVAHEPTARIFALNLVRLTDVAVREYEAAQSALELHAREWVHGNFSSYFEGVGHLEQCLTAMHRALRFADRLRQAKNAPKIDRAKLRMMGVDQIRVLRDAIQHLDDTAAKGLLTE